MKWFRRAGQDEDADSGTSRSDDAAQRLEIARRIVDESLRSDHLVLERAAKTIYRAGSGR